MKRTIAPPLGVLKDEAGFEVSLYDASERPSVEVDLDLDKVRSWLRPKKAVEHEEAILEFATRTTRRYILSKELYDRDKSATPREAKVYIERVRKAVADLQSVLRPDSGPERAVLRRMQGSAFIVADLATQTDALLRSANAFDALIEEPGRGGGKEADRQPKIEFAKVFVQTFERNPKWPQSTGPKSLMALLLDMCLRAADDPVAKVDQLLRDAKRELTV